MPNITQGAILTQQQCKALHGFYRSKQTLRAYLQDKTPAFIGMYGDETARAVKRDIEDLHAALKLIEQGAGNAKT
jgi:hypothetical protein